MSLRKYIFFLLVLSFLFSACKKETEDMSVEMKYSYYPNNIGHWVIYKVDSIIWDDNFTPPRIDTFHYYIKELIESNFYDNSGRQAQRLERYFRRNDTLEWTIKDVWYSNVTASAAEKVEENERFVKLVFPVIPGHIWNGNVYNTRDEWDYEYTAVDEQLSINSLNFDSTLTVKQYEDSTAINKDYSEEKFAKNVGLIFKYSYHLEINPVTNEISKGNKYTYTIVSWGN